MSQSALPALARPAEDRTRPADGPDWSRIPFEVPCPRCAANLHGRTGSRCPQCHTRLDWDQVLPIDRLCCAKCGYRLFALTEQRCPECAEPFDWPEALARARQQGVDLFEQRSWDQPAPALVRTWGLAAFRPRRLWTLYANAGTPRVLPLLLFLALQWLVFAQGWHVVAMAADPLMNMLGRTKEPPIRFYYNFRPVAGFMPFMALWHLATLVAMQAFIQSNSRFRVGWKKSLRVLVHSTALAALLPTVWCLSEVAVDASLLVTPRAASLAQRLYQPLQIGVYAVGLVLTWAYLWIGYRRHLRMPHGWGVSALVLLLGYLLAQLTLIFCY